MPEPEADKSMSNEDLAKHLATLRTGISSMLEQARALEALVKPPIVQELVLARRDMENSRMRFGVAEAMARGHDPWTNVVRKDPAK